MQHRDETDVNDCSFAHLNLILLLHYLVKRRTRRLAVHNNEFILVVHVGSENNRDHKIVKKRSSIRPHNH